MNNKGTLGVIIGNRDFFPDKLVSEARLEIMEQLERLHINYVVLDEFQTKLGGVETFKDAQRCAELFRRHASEIVGILVVLPNFGDERGVAETLKLAGLDVPVLVQAYPDELNKLDLARRRDSWCGKISVCNNLYQYGIKYTLTNQHVLHPKDPAFAQEVLDFLAVCRVVGGLKRLRIGAVGARPGGFNTVRYSEKLLQRHGISVITVDLSEILGRANRLTKEDASVKEHLDRINAYASQGKTPDEAMIQIAKLDVVLNQFMVEHDLDATAIQCWTSLQTNYGCNVCTSMSIMSENMLPSACEVDVTGTLSMYAMQLASSSPSALVDWNNNYADDANKCVLFHCGNWAKSFLPDVEISNAPILGTSVGVENTYGALDGRTPASPLTYGRISTDDPKGIIKAYIGEGTLTDDPLNTFGNRAVAQIPDLQRLMQYVCRNGFEHHVVMNASNTAGILKEALGNYMGWEVYQHCPEN
ncbi:MULTISPECIES: L-fucose/L-arabinose isomerase family protein [Olivibacter]|jgi:L-fucose isomerase-like protein|uniref:L-fucose/L-arabinose isomerase family protein n=1 Tax=Olivibacter oleidegradans TaxID=760123 RepID=A0ABV6HS94_9SPHI|nr:MULTISPECIES: L-fucose/L-arabinose isomerase family protein [unclassified Olivibacter]MDM8174456.1 L-fucose/L-arabinose isomerase family protein [Olivibacter sp. 47]QEL01210.1 fucose isomerase [Olivibacter sp. LS-1]